MTSQYYTLGTWDSTGKPQYLDTDEYIDPDYLDRINISLPNQSVPTYNPQYLSNTSSRNVIIQSTDPGFTGCDIYVTFLSEGAGYRNVFGYYWYPLVGDYTVPTITEDSVTRPMTYLDADLDDGNGKSYLNKTVIFPNASLQNSGGSLKPGNRVKLLYDPSDPTSVFPNNIGVGFFLIPNGWNSYTQQFTIKPNIVYSDSILNPPTASDPSGSIQTVLLSDMENSTAEQYVSVVGFEDIMRPGGDADFNDLVVKVTTTPNVIDDNGTLTLSPVNPIETNTLAADSTGLYINFTNATVASLDSVTTDNFHMRHHYRKTGEHKIVTLKNTLDNMVYENTTTVEYELDENDTPIGFNLYYTVPKNKLNKFLYIIKSTDNNLIPSVLDPEINNIVYFQNDYVFANDIDTEYLNITDDNNNSLLNINGRPDTSRMTSALAMGDPHLTTISGRKYTLHDAEGHYVLFKNKYLTVNTMISTYPFNKGTVYESLTFLHYVYIEYNHENIVIDLFRENKYYHFDEDDVMGNFDFNNGGAFNLITDEKNHKIINLRTKEMGHVKFEIKFDLDVPDLINDFSISSTGLYHNSASGLLVTPYQSAQIPALR